jgi:hypothetical protein
MTLAAFVIFFTCERLDTRKCIYDFNFHFQKPHLLMNSIFQNVGVIVKRKGAKPHYYLNLHARDVQIVSKSRRIELGLKVNSMYDFICSTGCFKNCPVRLLGTRFTNAISCFETGPQESYRDICGTPCRIKQHSSI